MANHRGTVLIFLLLFLLLFPDPSATPVRQQPETRNALARDYAALDELDRTRYGNFTPQDGHWRLNLTGFRQEEGLAWEGLGKVKERVKERIVSILGERGAAELDGPSDGGPPLYRNVSGYVRGKWVRSKVEGTFPAPHVDLSALGLGHAYSAHEYDRNVSGPEGNVRFRFDEKDDGAKDESSRIKDLSAHMVIHDDTSWGDGWELTLHGVHLLDSGTMVLTTTSEKFSGIFALPHLGLSEYMFNTSQELLNQTIRDDIEKRKEDPRGYTSPWSSSADGSGESIFSTPRCEFVVYLQQHPLQSASPMTIPTQDLLQQVENELRFPTGYYIPEIPSLTMSMVAFSPDCGFVLESKGPPEYTREEGHHLRGPKLEALIRDGRRHVLLFGIVMASQIFLTVRQLKEASTPSTRSRISFYTIAMLSMGDGFAGFALLPAGMFIESTFLPLLASAFLAFLAVTFFDLRFLMDIWSVQAQERRRQERQRPTPVPTPAPGPSGASTPAPPPQAQATPVTAPVITAAGADTLPLPVTARQAVNSGATPVILPPDQDDTPQGNTNTNTTEPTRRELGALYSRFYFVLLGTVFLSLHATSWPTTLRSAYTNFLAFVYLTFWCPQIYRNVMRNCRKALLWKFVIGQSILRFLPFAYFYAVSNNILFVENDVRALLVLAAWLWIQICVLVMQELLGPRIFIPEGWAPPAYDYHPVLREDEEGATMPIGFTQAAEEEAGSPSTSKSGESRDKSKRVFDCAICMQNIEVPVVSTDGGSGEGGAAALGGNILARRAYMVTPCRHIFHTPCLEGWMRYRLQCPICRETLPPL